MTAFDQSIIVTYLMINMLFIARQNVLFTDCFNCCLIQLKHFVLVNRQSMYLAFVFSGIIYPLFVSIILKIIANYSSWVGFYMPVLN